MDTTWITNLFRKGAPEAVQMAPILSPISWPPLHYGHNEPGPTGIVGEYRTHEPGAPGQMRAAGAALGARIPGEVRPYGRPLNRITFRDQPSSEPPSPERVGAAKPPIEKATPYVHSQAIEEPPLVAV